MTIVEDSINYNIRLCECGCGQPCKKRFIHGHNIRILHFKGETHPSWKGGRKICGDGYIVVKKWNHPYCDVQGYVLEHRLVMEKHLGRYLDPKEVVHHINGIKSDNRIENLMLFESHSKHMAYEKIKDMSNRICLICKSDKTYIDKHGYIKWHRHDNGFICMKCYMQKW